jgi:hypothetical protein
LLSGAIPYPKHQHLNALTTEQFALSVLLESRAIAVSFRHDREPSRNGSMPLCRSAQAGRCKCISLEWSRQAMAKGISMNIVWIILSVSIAGVIAKWAKSAAARQSHLGFVSHQWLADHRLSHPQG